MITLTDREQCVALDAADPLRDMRDRFVVPDGVVYLDGNSLGALPVQTAPRMVATVAREWGQGLVRSWSDAGWIEASQRVGAKVATLIGAGPGEVLIAESTTVCLFKLVCAALSMREGRHVVLTEEENFHTDRYVAESAARMSGGVLRVVPRSRLLQELTDDVAVLLLTHVDYRTGFMHHMGAMSAAAHEAGALAFWDLSHSAGAVPLFVNADGADLAVGCGYKYLNGGPGAPAFLHVRAGLQPGLRTPIPGWLGHADPFAFEPAFRPAPGLGSMISGTPNILQLAALESGVDVWLDADMYLVREKSIALTELFIALVDERCAGLGLEVLTPRDPSHRGSQVALGFAQAYGLIQALIAAGVVGDFRVPDVCRFGFTPLYLRHVDVWDAVDCIRQVITSGAHLDPRYATRAYVT